MNSFRFIATSFCCITFVFGVLPLCSNAQLHPSFYSKTCPNVNAIVREVVRNFTMIEPRMPAILIRLHFHDCFVQVCIYYEFN